MDARLQDTQTRSRPLELTETLDEAQGAAGAGPEAGHSACQTTAAASPRVYLHAGVPKTMEQKLNLELRDGSGKTLL